MEAPDNIFCFLKTLVESKTKTVFNTKKESEMKKKIFVLGMTVLILSLSFVFTGCPGDGGGGGGGGDTYVFAHMSFPAATYSAVFPGTPKPPIGSPTFITGTGNLTNAFMLVISGDNEGVPDDTEIDQSYSQVQAHLMNNAKTGTVGYFPTASRNQFLTTLKNNGYAIAILAPAAGPNVNIFVAAKTDLLTP